VAGGGIHLPVNRIPLDQLLLLLVVGLWKFVC